MDKTCAECGAAARRLRKERCDACYMRLYRRGEPPPGARCAACDERRRPLLDLAELGGAAVVLCGNCALVLARARPRPETLAALTARLDRERRRTADRRIGAVIEQGAERRLGPRRARERRPAFDPTID